MTNLPAKHPVFEQKKDGTRTTYRIPALIHLPSTETLLAFAEERSSWKDVDAKMLVVRKGRLCGNDVEWGDLEKVEKAHLPCHRSMSPCPLYDSSRQQLFLFFNAIPDKVTESHQLQSGKNEARLCYVSTSDQGSSWHGPTDLTESTQGLSLQNWATFALGPGHGIQLHSGRLLVPAYAYRIDSRKCRSSPHSFTIYSDDHGVQWSCGKLVTKPTLECQLVSLDEGQSQCVLYCNARTSEGHRAQALSWDRGTVFQEELPIPSLVEPPSGCHGSVVGFPASALGRTEESGASDSFSSPVLPAAATCVLYCHPTDPKKRRDLGIYLSTAPQDPTRWSKPWLIHLGPSAYSDLAYIQRPGSPAFVCLYECGSSEYHETIAYRLFTMQELRDNIPQSPGETRKKISANHGVCCRLT